MGAAIALSWKEHAHAVGYRVILYRSEGEEYVKLEVPDAECRVPPDALDPRGRYDWRVEYRAAARGEWQPLFPYVGLDRDPPPAPAIVLSWPDAGALAYRVIVRDETADAILHKLGVMGTQLVLDPLWLPADHVMRWRVQQSVGADWVDWSEYESLPAPVSVEASDPPAASTPLTIRSATPLPTAQVSTLGPRALALFTCDTEVSMRMVRDPSPGRGLNEQVFGRVGGREVGIHYLMDRLDEHGMRGTFFVDVLMEFQFGERALKTVVDAILSREHDVQLHLHPAPHLRFSDDPAVRALHSALIGDDPQQFSDALQIGIEVFERAVGVLPVAYRSGAYHLTDAYLPVLSRHGIHIDSSLWPFRNCRVSPWMWSRTQPFWVDDVLELPISWILRDQLDGLSYEQFAPVLHPRFQTGVLREARLPTTGPPLVWTYIAHSYSMLQKLDDPDPAAYQRWNTAVEKLWPAAEFPIGKLTPDAPVRHYGPPDERRMTAFDDLLASLGARGDIESITLAELQARDPRSLGLGAPHAGVEPLGIWHDAAGQGGLTVSQRYSSWYLEHLEQMA